MREPDAWWDHVPVISRSYCKNLGEYWDWHKQQLDEALKEVSHRYGEAMGTIPPTGFYLMAARNKQKYKNGQPEDLVTAVALFEDEDCILHFPKTARGSIVVRGGVVHQPLDVLGSSENPFVSLFENIAMNAPNEWPEYLKFRRPQRWKPTPEWLVNLRREERRKRRSGVVARVSR